MASNSFFWPNNHISMLLRVRTKNSHKSGLSNTTGPQSFHSNKITAPVHTLAHDRKPTSIAPPGLLFNKILNSRKPAAQAAYQNTNRPIIVNHIACLICNLHLLCTRGVLHTSLREVYLRTRLV